MKSDYDVAIIGAGPAGYTAAIRASQLGLKVALVEENSIGGICLNWGCIPTKTIINIAKNFSNLKKLEEFNVIIDKSNFDYFLVYKRSREVSEKLSKGVSFLLNKNKVEIFKGKGKLVDRNTISINNEKNITSKYIILATGSRPKGIKGFEFDSDIIYSSTDLLNMKNLPSSVAIIGGGAIGVEFAYILNSFGTKVTLFEILPTILPNIDKEISSTLNRTFIKQGINIYTNTKIIGYEKSQNGARLFFIDDNKEQYIDIDKIVVATGRIGNIENVGLEKVGIEIKNNFIKTYEYFQTNIENIYAIGDVTEFPKLAHVASKMAEIAVENIAGIKGAESIKEEEIPFAIYSEPQLAGFGFTEEAAQQKGINYQISKYFYRANGKALAIDEIDGFIKIIFNKDTKEIFGCFIIGSNATELIHEVLVAKKNNLTPLEIADVIHAHPTLSEIIMEGSKNIYNKAIHM